MDNTEHLIIIYIWTSIDHISYIAEQPIRKYKNQYLPFESIRKDLMKRNPHMAAANMLSFREVNEDFYRWRVNQLRDTL